MGPLSPEVQQLKNYVDESTRSLQHAINGLSGSLRTNLSRELAQKTVKIEQQLTELASIASAIAIQKGGAGANTYLRPEDVPGKRIPYMFCLDMPISGSSATQVQQSLPITMEGLFVATRRICCFQSSAQIQYTDPDTQAISNFAGRSNGRYRPTSSLADIVDALGSIPLASISQPLVNGTKMASVQFPGSMSGYRTMEFDGKVLLVAAGSSVPRSNVPVPTPGWSQGIGEWQDFSYPDIYERGEVLQVTVTPNHLNNPAAGNVSGVNIFGTDGYPFLQGQYDAQEGIMTPGALTVAGGNVTQNFSTDPINRVYDGIFTVILEGYRIMNPGTGIV